MYIRSIGRKSQVTAYTGPISVSIGLKTEFCVFRKTLTLYLSRRHTSVVFSDGEFIEEFLTAPASCSCFHETLEKYYSSAVAKQVEIFGRPGKL